MGDLIRIQDYRTIWISARAICGWCGLAWGKVYPATVEGNALPCPGCEQSMGVMQCCCEGLCEQDEGCRDEIWAFGKGSTG
jgi:hypothetical protein